MHGLLKLCNALTVTVALLTGSHARSLPIGFGEVPADKQYQELKSKNFYIYHDVIAPQEARGILNSLEAAKPSLENWFKEKRSSPMPVIVSARTDNASFANFITDAIELQTLGQGSRDLAWHEYVHATMYRHFLNWLGPAGSILHLVWLPSWYVEGLAEALSVSIGSDQQAAIERHHALTGRWPSYARLHSLYTNADFAQRGYAASGAFVAYLLRRGMADKLPEFLNHYFHMSMPWMWPYSILPLKYSMPLDHSLRKYFQASGEDLYQEYKAAALAHWKKSGDLNFFTPPRDGDKGHDFDFSYTLRSNGSNVELLARRDDRTMVLSEAKFSGDWAHSRKDKRELPFALAPLGYVQNGDQDLYLINEKNVRGTNQFRLERRAQGQSISLAVIDGEAYANDLYATQSHVVWSEHWGETTRICTLPKTELVNDPRENRQKKRCPYTATHPQQVAIVGAELYQQKKASAVTRTLWIKITEQTLEGDRHKLKIWTPDFDQEQSLSHAGVEAVPLSFALAGDQRWLLYGETRGRTLMAVDPSGACTKIARLGNLAYALHGLNDGTLIVPMFNGNATAVMKLNPERLSFEACRPLTGHLSPLLASQRARKKISLAAAAEQSSLWQTTPASTSDDNQVAQRLSLNQAIQKSSEIDATSQPTSWRARPIFGVPWLGADADGLQFGVLSVPLMEHMQNEDVRLYFGYGLSSNYPNTELSLTSTRFWPTLKLDVFRYQTWNGRYFQPDNRQAPTAMSNDNDASDVDLDRGDYEHAYLDEKGARVSSAIFFPQINTTLVGGFKASLLEKYIGPAPYERTHLNEPFLEVSKSTRLGSFIWSKAFELRVAPDFMNERYDYNVLGVRTAVQKNFNFLDSSLQVGGEASRHRGEQLREFQEYYRPLKIFVPSGGSGGIGYNNLNFPLYGGGGLFVAKYGDTQGRVEGSYGFPIIEEVDRLVRLLYWESVSFTAFANYGGAWQGDEGPKRRDLIGAHGYNIDAHFDIKGLNFHLGGGVGQAFGYFPDLYASFSFDAIF